MRHRASILVVVLVLGACGPASAPEPMATIPAAATPADWQRIELEALSFALPPTWAITQVDASDATAAINELIKHNPQLAALVREGEAAIRAGQIDLVAYDLDPSLLREGETPASLRVGSQQGESALSAGQVAAANEAQLRATPGFSNIERAAVMIAATPATRLTSTVTITDTAGQPLAFHSEQYLLIDGNTAHMLSFTLPASQHVDLRALLDRILATVRLKE